MDGISKRLRDGIDTGWTGDAACVEASLAEEAADAIDALVAALEKARDELQGCSVEITGEDYNSPELNAALALAGKR